MSSTRLKGEHVSLSGDLPENGTKISLKELVRADLSVVSLDDFRGRRKILNIFPSIDTGICATSVRHFNAAASNLTNTVVLNLSQDLPFALGRFCAAEGIKNCETLSTFRNTSGKDLGILLTDSQLCFCS